ALVWQSARGTITPWVVEVDKFGEARAVVPAEDDWNPSDPQIAFHLARFIEHVRSIPADPVGLRNDWLAAYDFARDGGARALNDSAWGSARCAGIGKARVAFDVSSVIRASRDSFRIASTERRYQAGSLTERSRWSAILTVRIEPPRTPGAIRQN